MQQEEWRKVKSLDNLYEISNFGNFRSLPRIVPSRGKTRLSPGKLLSQSSDKDGYKISVASIYGKRINVKIHALVAQEFLNHSDKSKEINHINGLKYDNNILNLEVVTKAQNEVHKHILTNKKRGVSLSSKTFADGMKRWCSSIKVNKISIYLGHFLNKEDAHQAYYNKHLEIYGVAPWK